MEATITCWMTWASSRGTSENCRSRMVRSRAESHSLSRMWVECRLIGILRCPTTRRFKWNPGLTQAHLVKNKRLRKKSWTRKSSRSSQEEAVWNLVSKWTLMCSTIQKKWESITWESFSKSWMASLWASNLKVRLSIDGPSSSWSSTPMTCLLCLLVSNGPSPTQ